MKRVFMLFFSVLILLTFSFNSYSSERFYVVKKGDTLWGISKKFYKNPFLWGKIWYKNTYINNPYLIFPGEVLVVGKNGLMIYKSVHHTKKIKKVVKRKKVKEEKYISAVWFNGNKFYSTCGSHLCVWKKSEFRIAQIKFDTYSNIEATQGDIVYLLTSMKNLPKRLYIYRKNRDLTHYNHNFDPVYLPIGEIRVLKKIKSGVFRAKIVKAVGSVSMKDAVSAVYPFICVKGVPKLVKVGRIKVKEILVANNELQNRIGILLFFEASKRLPIVLGKKVVLARINKNAFEPIDIGEGVVISQYNNYVGIFFPASNGLKEMPDRTQEYILR